MHRVHDIRALAFTVARQMRLPIDVHVEMASHLAPLTGADAAGGAVAHVGNLEQIPIYGSSRLEGYPVRLVLTRDFSSASLETSVAILAHEFSHVLLHSLRHPSRESETLTDLVPLALGFDDIVATARDLFRSAYLTDTEFCDALQHVRHLRFEVRARCELLTRSVGRTRRHIERGRSLLAEIETLKRIVDDSRPKIRRADAERIVRLHSTSYFEEHQYIFRAAERHSDDPQSRFLDLSNHEPIQLTALAAREREQHQTVRTVDTAYAELLRDAAALSRSLGAAHIIQCWRYRRELRRCGVPAALHEPFGGVVWGSTQ